MYKRQKYIRALPYAGFRVDCTIDFPHPTIGRERFSMEVTPENFTRVANCLLYTSSQYPQLEGEQKHLVHRISLSLAQSHRRRETPFCGIKKERGRDAGSPLGEAKREGPAFGERHPPLSGDGTYTKREEA